MSDNRKVCPYCEQELAHTAYSRHLNDKTGRVCPGKGNYYQNESREVSRSPRAADLDSTFDVGSASDGSDGANVEDDFANTSCDREDDAPDSLISDTDSDSMESSDGEVWDDTESEEDSEREAVSSSVSEIVLGISYFLTLYHLLYRLSEQAITSLLGFIRLLFHFLAVITGENLLFGVFKTLPKSMRTVRKNLKEDNFVEYVVCPKCCKLYFLQDCVVSNHGCVESKLCDYIEFPNHPLSSKRMACGEALLKRIKIGNKTKLVARKTFVYRSILESLKALAKRKGFLKKCDMWRSRPNNFSPNLMGDIYDGNLWHDFKTIGDRPFLALPNNLCLSINIDWFRVYEHSQYSAGPIYLVVLNLPRNERYKEENVILVGIIPGPKEPKLHINTFLVPLVKDLKKLYEGITFQNSSSLSGFTTIRAVLGCVVCDLPATRKVCGFANFNGNYGCSKCMKNFVTSAFGSKPSYAGFDCNNWCPRDLSTHKSVATEYLQANTVSKQKKIIHDSGVKFSELLNIPCFDIIRCHVVDPMHNIFLGLAKHVIHTWKELGILQVQHFVKVQEKVDLIVPPPKVGHIPRKIESGFASFTADEWKNFILIYSSFALQDVVDTPHYDCWSLLVSACALLCQPILPRDCIDQAHVLLIEFCQLFETIYGVEHCTPNMHMSLHLKECLLDFGPLPAFWCFAFERYNGILEGISKSWIAPEKQMFLKFSEVQELQSLGESLGKYGDFLSLVCDHMDSKAKGDLGSVGQTLSSDSLMLHDLTNVSCSVSQIAAQKKSHQQLVAPFKEKYFRNTELACLEDMYNLLYPSKNFEVSRFYKEYKKIIINNVEFISKQSRSQRSAVVAAKWPGVIGIDRQGESLPRIGLVLSFIDHEITMSSPDHLSSTSHILMRVQWYGDHPQRDCIDSCIITSTVFDSDSSACFMPVSRVMCQCAISSPFSMQFDYGLDTVLIAVPLCIEHNE